MKKIFSILFLSGILFSNAQNGKGTMFPECSGETFSGKTVNIPSQTKGKVTILWVAFSRDAEEDMKTWLNPVYNLFVVKKDTNDFYSAAVNYDVNFYFIPMLNQLNQALGNKDKIKEKTDKEFWPFVMYFKGEVKPYIEALKIEDKKIPYFFVLDAAGKILHVESGRYSEAKMDKIEDFLD
ncbi:MAG: hypothetical protein IAF38_09310 [Bacteroidia bacterium]|nr:hypothetical protein [Bacteroidia bacterium]